MRYVGEVPIWSPSERCSRQNTTSPSASEGLGYVRQNSRVWQQGFHSKDVKSRELNGENFRRNRFKWNDKRVLWCPGKDRQKQGYFPTSMSARSGRGKRVPVRVRAMMCVCGLLTSSYSHRGWSYCQKPGLEHRGRGKRNTFNYSLPLTACLPWLCPSTQTGPETREQRSPEDIEPAQVIEQDRRLIRHGVKPA